jgi:hypothetical protein
MAETNEFHEKHSHFPGYRRKRGKMMFIFLGACYWTFFVSQGSAALPSRSGSRLKIDYGRLPNVKRTLAVTNERCVCALEEIGAAPIGRRQPHDDKWEGSFVVHSIFWFRPNVWREMDYQSNLCLGPWSSSFGSWKVRVIWRICWIGWRVGLCWFQLKIPTVGWLFDRNEV